LGSQTGNTISPGATAGIVLGIGGAAGLAGGSFFIYKRYKKMRRALTG